MPNTVYTWAELLDMDGQCETRPCRKRHGLENDPGYYQRQRKVDTSSCKNLIIGKHLTEEKRRRPDIHIKFKDDNASDDLFKREELGANVDRLSDVVDYGGCVGLHSFWS